MRTMLWCYPGRANGMRAMMGAANQMITAARRADQPLVWIYYLGPNLMDLASALVKYCAGIQQLCNLTAPDDKARGLGAAGRDLLLDFSEGDQDYPGIRFYHGESAVQAAVERIVVQFGSLPPEATGIVLVPKILGHAFRNILHGNDRPPGNLEGGVIEITHVGGHDADYMNWGGELG